VNPLQSAPSPVCRNRRKKRLHFLKQHHGKASSTSQPRHSINLKIPGVYQEGGVGSFAGPEITVWPLPQYNALHFFPMDAPDPPYFVGEFEEVTVMPIAEQPMFQQLGYEPEDLRGFQSYLPTLMDEQEEDGALDELPYPARCMADGFNTFPSLPVMPAGLGAPSARTLSGVNCVPQRTPPPAWGMDTHHLIQPSIPSFHDHCQEDDLASMSIRSEVFHDHASDHWRPRLQDWMMPLPSQPTSSQGRPQPSQVLQRTLSYISRHTCSVFQVFATLPNASI
jgi:hypothetical protein